MAGYGGEEFRKVAGIGSITRPNPDGGGGGGYHRDRRNKKGQDKKGFASFLDDERSAIRDVGDISIKSTGYSPKGTPQSFMVEMRDYTFQKTIS